jgi:hypothetical protein
VSVHEFVFALELSDGARFDAMLADVAMAVLNAVGCSGDSLVALTALLHKAVSDGARGQHQCAIRFQAHDGQLRIAIACAGQPERQTTFALP